MQDEQQRREFGATVRQPTLPSYMYQVPVRQMQDEEQLRKLGATPRRNERSQTDSSGSESSGSESEDEELHAFGGKKRPQREKVDSSPGPSQNLNLSGNSPRLSGYGGGSGSQAPQGNGGGSAGSGSGSGAGAGGSGGASGSGSGNNPGSNMDGTGGYSYRRIQAAGAPPPPPPSGSYGGYNMSSYLPQPQQNTMYRNVTSGYSYGGSEAAGAPPPPSGRSGDYNTSSYLPQLQQQPTSGYSALSRPRNAYTVYQDQDENRILRSLGTAAIGADPRRMGPRNREGVAREPRYQGQVLGRTTKPRADTRQNSQQQATQESDYNLRWLAAIQRDPQYLALREQYTDRAALVLDPLYQDIVRAAKPRN